MFIRRDVPRPLRALFPLLLLALVGCAIPGQTAHQMGRYDVNIEAFEGQLARGQQLSAIDYAYLCEAYVATKNYAKIFACADQFLKADAILFGFEEAAVKASFTARAESWRVQAYLETGRYAEAVAAASRGMAGILEHPLFGRPHDVEHKLLSLKGIAQANLKDVDGALRTVQDIENVYCGFVGGAWCGEEKSQALTGVYVALGRFADAGRVMEKGTLVKAWGSIVLAGGLDYYMVPRTFLQAKVNYETGKTAEAKAAYAALLDKPSTRSSGTIHWSVLCDLGRIARAEGDAKGAASRLAEAVGIIESQRANINSEAAKIGFIGDKQAVYAELVSLLVEQGRAAEAFEYVERAKSRALVDLLAERQSFAAPDQTGTAESLKLLASLEQKSVASGAKSDEQVRLRSALTDLTAELRQKTPELASLVTVSAPRAADIQARLAADETLLEYYGSGGELYAFCVTRDAVRAVKLDGRGMEADVRSFREALAKVGSDAWRPLARSLHDRLVAPLPGALDRPRLIIVGHGALHYLPWGALVDSQQGGRFLVDRAALTLLPSASVMQFLAARTAATARDMLILGNPDLGRPDMDLPGAEAEARAIKGIWPDSTMLMRKAATKAALTRAGGLFRVIHVAAHGEFASDQPLASRLLLAPEGSDDGRLTAGDLYGLKLNADLVTLSACETGLGKVLSGDDVVGLTRGFLYAGAGSIVASLWPVSDDETKFLMTSFYGNLKKLSKPDALRQAQLETRKKHPHPFYWSAFQLTGLGR